MSDKLSDKELSEVLDVSPYTAEAESKAVRMACELLELRKQRDEWLEPLNQFRHAIENVMNCGWHYAAENMQKDREELMRWRTYYGKKMTMVNWEPSAAATPVPKVCQSCGEPIVDGNSMQFKEGKWSHRMEDGKCIKTVYELSATTTLTPFGDAAP